jgi:hypothetical protein
MVEEEKIEERKRDNAPFLRAFQFLLDQNVASGKGELAKKIGIQPGLISLYAKGIKRVSEETKMSLVRISRANINMNYLMGKSQYMLLANVPDDEIVEMEMRRDNPDYDLMEARKAEKEDAAKDELIATLKSQIADLRIQLVDKQNVIEAKDQLIDSLKMQINNMMSEMQIRGISTYPFEMGVSERLSAPNKI